MRVVENCPAFEASNLPGRPAASSPNIIDETQVDAERFRGRDSCFLTDFLNDLGLH